MKSAALLPAILLAAAGLHAQQLITAQFTPPNQSSNQGFAVAGVAKCATDPATGKIVCTPVASPQQPAINRCPIAMQARQGGGLRVERAQDGQTPAQPFLTPSLTLRNPKNSRIVSASVTAHGFGANNGATLLAMRERKHNNDDSPDEFLYHVPSSGPPVPPFVTQTLSVKFTPSDDHAVSSEFSLRGFVTLRSIELNSVTFADGSVQNFASDSGCSVQPDLLMLVDGN